MPNLSRHSTPVFVGGDNQVAPLRRVELGKNGGGGEHREEFIQKLVHQHPNIIPMQDIEPAFMPLLPICMELPTAAGYLDNLWLTPSGGIVLGECKLVRNTQARREVLVQALDYARALNGWHYDDLQDAVRKARKEPDLSLWQLVADASDEGDRIGEATFTDAVERRLRDGRFVVLVILDGVQEGLEALTSYLQLHAGLHVSLALVELSIWQGVTEGLIVVPRIPLRTVLVERGIVTINATGQVRIAAAGPAQAPKVRTPTQLPSPFTNSQAEFYDRLELKVPGAGVLVRSLVRDVEALGIVAEYGRSLVLRWHPSPDVAASAGYIDAFGAVWLGDAYRAAVRLGNEPAGTEYLETLARSVGGSVQRYEGDTTPPRVRGPNGQTVSVTELLTHSEQWKSAIEQLMASTTAQE
jgi:hypothetical protein